MASVLTLLLCRTTASTIDLLQQVRHRDGLDTVTQGLVQGTSEGVIGTVREPVIQFVAICFIGRSDILIPISGKELEVFLTASSTDLCSWDFGKLDLVGTSPGNSSTLAVGIFPVELQILKCLCGCKGWSLEFCCPIPLRAPIVGALQC
jgi:hypothetical protein